MLGFNLSIQEGLLKAHAHLNPFLQKGFFNPLQNELNLPKPSKFVLQMVLNDATTNIKTFLQTC